MGLRASVMLVAVGCTLLAACGPLGGGSEGGGSLVGPIWQLTQLGGQALAPGTEITARFDAEGKVGGSAGCNSYHGAYSVDGRKISMGPFATTMMACPGPVMDQETAYLAALEAAASYDISGDELRLKDADGHDVAVYGIVSQDLASTSWDVIAYNNGKGGVVSVIIGTEITADFGEGGQLMGSAGCNNYVAEYEAEGDRIAISSAVATTRKACPEEGVMAQENAYLAALETADTYDIQGTAMEMRTDDGAKVAGFQRAPGK